MGVAMGEGGSEVEEERREVVRRSTARLPNF